MQVKNRPDGRKIWQIVQREAQYQADPFDVPDWQDDGDEHSARQSIEFVHSHGGIDLATFATDLWQPLAHKTPKPHHPRGQWGFGVWTWLVVG